MRWIDRIIRIVAAILMALLAAVVVGATVDLAITLLREFASAPHGRFDVRQVLATLGLFLAVLIAIEMLHVVRLYLEERHFDAEAVLIVALVAIARKIVVFDIEKGDSVLMFGISAVVLSLAGALCLLRWSRRLIGPPSPPPS